MIISNSYFYGKNLVNSVIGDNSFNFNGFHDVFYETYSDFNGAAISLTSVLSMQLIDSLIFSSVAAIFGGGIYLQDTSVFIKNTNFIECKTYIAGSAVYFTVKNNVKSKNFSIIASNMLNNNDLSLYIYKAMNIYVISTIYNMSKGFLYSFMNGVGYFETIEEYVVFYNNTLEGSYMNSAIKIVNNGRYFTNILINNSFFANCYTLDNGAVFNTIGLINLKIFDTIFINNTANLSGGVIYFSCGVENTCSFQTYSSKYINNSAIFSGGGIHFTENNLISFRCLPEKQIIGRV